MEQVKKRSSAVLLSRERHKGTVVWFNANLGYGFIHHETSVNAGQDLFVHYHNVIARGFRRLADGDEVEFSVGRNERGVCAIDVRILKCAEAKE